MRILSAFLLAIVTLAANAQDRQLYWDTLDVKARLEADGRLHVAETQRMVFTGDWNGGERTFDIRPRQQLSFGGMSRIDPSGAEIPMTQGSLDTVDQWDYAGPDAIRWRARNATDPAFNKTAMTYVLRYALSNVLLQDGDQYVLDHDFAFAKRDGRIEHFRLELELDPVWKPSGPLQKTWTVENIPPGKSFVLRVPLKFAGEGVPEADGGLSDEARWMLLAFVGVPLLLLAYVIYRETVLGRFEPPPAEVSRAWLERNLLREKPEIIGAMWDEEVGAAEVSATIARLVAEGRLESKVVGGEMDLTIVTRKDLNAYEQALIDGLFFRGNHTSTSKIQSHYAESGFDPAAAMSKELMQAVQERLPKGTTAPPWKYLSTIFFLGAIAALGYLVVRHSQYFVHAIFVLFGAMFLSVLAGIAPNHWRTRKLLGLRAALYSMIPAAIVVSGVAYVVWRSSTKGSPDIPMEFQLALTALALWIFAVAVQALRSRESRESIAFIKMFSTTREYFRNELKKERPALDDAWYPYILAFGLNDDVERWYKAFPGASASRDDDRWRSSTSTSSSSSSSGSSFSGSGWSGGGGAFGGAGASGMWAAAATGMAAGVAAPSSSSSDSGGSSSSSSSGGSSGGGGGGGW